MSLPKTMKLGGKYCCYCCCDTGSKWERTVKSRELFSLPVSAPGSDWRRGYTRYAEGSDDWLRLKTLVLSEALSQSSSDRTGESIQKNQERPESHCMCCLDCSKSQNVRIWRMKYCEESGATNWGRRGVIIWLTLYIVVGSTTRRFITDAHIWPWSELFTVNYCINLCLAQKTTK